MLPLEVPSTLGSLHPVFHILWAIKRARAEEGGGLNMCGTGNSHNPFTPNHLQWQRLYCCHQHTRNYVQLLIPLWTSRWKSDGPKMWEKKCLLSTITITWTVSHSFVVILDLLILVEETVFQPGLPRMPWNFQRDKFFISGNFILYYI